MKKETKMEVLDFLKFKAFKEGLFGYLYYWIEGNGKIPTISIDMRHENVKIPRCLLPKDLNEFIDSDPIFALQIPYKDFLSVKIINHVLHLKPKEDDALNRHMFPANFIEIPLEAIVNIYALGDDVGYGFKLLNENENVLEKHLKDAINSKEKEFSEYENVIPFKKKKKGKNHLRKKVD